MEAVDKVYPKKYTRGFCFAVLCCRYTLTDFPISIRLTSLALWQSNDCPSASKATLMNMDKYFMWIHYERLHNHNKAKHNKTVCIFLGIYCILPEQPNWPMAPTPGLISRHYLLKVANRGGMFVVALAESQGLRFLVQSKHDESHVMHRMRHLLRWLTAILHWRGQHISSERQHPQQSPTTCHPFVCAVCAWRMCRDACQDC